MPIIKQYNLVTNDVRDNENVFFMFLENKKRIGGGHIAMLLRDSSNAIPLTVKKSNGQGIAHYFHREDLVYATDDLIFQLNMVRLLYFAFDPLHMQFRALVMLIWI